MRQKGISKMQFKNFTLFSSFSTGCDFESGKRKGKREGKVCVLRVCVSCVTNPRTKIYNEKCFFFFNVIEVLRMKICDHNMQFEGKMKKLLRGMGEKNFRKYLENEEGERENEKENEKIWVKFKREREKEYESVRNAICVCDVETIQRKKEKPTNQTPKNNTFENIQKPRNVGFVWNKDNYY